VMRRTVRSFEEDVDIVLLRRALRCARQLRAAGLLLRRRRKDGDVEKERDEYAVVARALPRSRRRTQRVSAGGRVAVRASSVKRDALLCASDACRRRSDGSDATIEAGSEADDGHDPLFTCCKLASQG
jgi:hypothetical protein